MLAPGLTWPPWKGLEMPKYIQERTWLGEGAALVCTSLGITRSPFSLALWGMGSLPGTTNYDDLK